MILWVYNYRNKNQSGNDLKFQACISRLKIFFSKVKKTIWGMGMEMAMTNQLGQTSIYACCITRVKKDSH